jgi:CBS-domain-containing membrane protein
VVDSDDKVMGLVNLYTLRQAQAGNVGQLAGMELATALQVDSDQPIGAIIPLMAACDNTVAVVDKAARMIGEVSRVDLLKALMSKEAENDHH